MDKHKTNQRGITLVALVITIVVMVILVAIAVRGLAGNDGLIKTTEIAAENYNITAEKARLEQVVRNKVVADATVGKESGLHDLLDEIRAQEGVKEAEIIEENPDGSGSIIVVTDNGDIYQIYYDPTYGIIKIEYIGNINDIGGLKPGESITDYVPTLKAELTNRASITAEATVNKRRNKRSTINIPRRNKRCKDRK